ncbi:MAG TPA: GNAT family N-acetyltransferase [Pyrinomonadaceae bacterium]|nr:GNAT family N-acetyltransferase [Pyrinomonadaceae bacterium]
MTILETERLTIRELNDGDAPFILQLLNEPSFIYYIGDKGVRTLEDARQYILNGPVISYERNGFGLNLVSFKETSTPIGMCGLLKRDELPDPDIGFAFLPEYWSKGFGFEAASAVLKYGFEVLRLQRILAITSPDNEGSGRLLTKIGLKYEQMYSLSDDRPEVKLFVIDFGEKA